MLIEINIKTYKKVLTIHILFVNISLGQAKARQKWNRKGKRMAAREKERLLVLRTEN